MDQSAAPANSRSQPPPLRTTTRQQLSPILALKVGKPSALAVHAGAAIQYEFGLTQRREDRNLMKDEG
jgi:hypothetical protein